MVAGNQDHEGYRQGHRSGDSESAGRNENERTSGFDSENPEGRAYNREAKTAGPIEN